jgi:DNA primase
MSFDSDGAGFKAADRGAKIALGMGMEVKIAKLPAGFDPADLILKDHKGWVEALKNSRHIIDFHLSNLMESGMDARKIGRAIQVQVLPYVAMLQSNIEKSYFVSEISKKANIREEAIWEDLKGVKIEERSEPEKNVSAKNPILRKDSIEKKILGIIFWQKGLEKPAMESKEIEKRFGEVVGEEKLKEILAFGEGQKDALIFETEAYYNGRDFKNDLDELFQNLREEYLKHELGKIMAELAVADRIKDESRKPELLNKYQEISKNLDKLKRKT